MNVPDVLALFGYDRWANAEVLDIAAGIGDERLHRASAASYESVFGTLVHVLWSEWIWLCRWTPRVAAADPRSCADLGDLRERWASFEKEQRAFLEALTEADILREVSYENPPGTTWTYSLQQMLQHVANHATYHRGQLTTLFRELGVKPRPIDFLVYIDVLDSQRRASR